MLAVACATVPPVAEIPATILGTRTIGHTLEGDPVFAVKAEFQDGETVVRWEFRASQIDMMRFRSAGLCAIKRGERFYEARPCLER